MILRLQWNLAIPSRFEGLRLTLVLWLLVSPAFMSPGLDHSVCLQTCTCSMFNEVNCGTRYLTSVPVVGRFPPTTKNLILSRNLLTTIENDAFYLLSTLTVLRLKANFISTIEPRAFSRLSRLSILHLSENSLVDIFAIPPIRSVNLDFNFIQQVNCDCQQVSAFNSARESHISMSNNFIVGLSNLTLPVSNVVARSSNLRVFDIHEMKSAHRIIFIDVSENYIRLLPDITNLTRLKTLIVSGNPIHVVQVLHWPKSMTLLELDLANRAILPELSSSQITQLILSGTGISSKKDLLYWDVDFFESLHITRSLIRDINDFPQAPNLETLNIRQSNLTGDLILSPCSFPMLSHIEFQDNNITKFIILRNKHDDWCGIDNPSMQIRYLNLVNNQIGDTNFLRNLSSLSSLLLSHNKIRTVNWTALNQNTELYQLYISGNYLNSVDEFIQLGQLKFLDLSHNQIKFIVLGAFDGSPNLSMLKLNHNKLIALPDVTPLPLLHILDLKCNDIEIVKFEHMEGWFNIDISSNKIKKISSQDISKYSRIILQNITLKSLDQLNISSAEELIELDVSHNLITSIDNPDWIERKLEQFFVDHNHLHNVSLPTRTEIFKCSHNNINYLPENTKCTNVHLFCETMCDLRELHAGWNKITAINGNAFNNCSMLKKVYLQGNPLKSLSSDIISSLLSFSLSHTLLRSADIKIESYNFSTLDIEMNNVTLFRQHPNVSLQFSLPFLKFSLLLCCNAITVLHSIDAPLLRSLDLSHNRIHSLSENPFEKLAKVRFIDLQDNVIGGVPQHAFTSCLSIDEINLEHNQIEFIAQSAFINRSSLTIRLGGNRLMTLQPSSFPLLSKKIYLDPNPWHCDFELTTLKRWLLQSGVHGVNCVTPSEHENKNLIILSYLELDSCLSSTPDWVSAVPDELLKESLGNSRPSLNGRVPSRKSRGLCLKGAENCAIISFLFHLLCSTY